MITRFECEYCENLFPISEVRSMEISELNLYRCLCEKCVNATLNDSPNYFTHSWENGGTYEILTVYPAKFSTLS